MNPSSFFRIGIVGPESAGKTTLARALSAWYGNFWVAEQARSYLSELKRAPQERDLLTISKQQQAQENLQAKKAQNCGHRLLFCDSTQLTTHIWALYVYDRCHSWIADAWKAEDYALYLLCAPDVPWEADPLRSLPDQSEREKVFEWYEKSLKEEGHPYSVLRGEHFMRLQQAVAAMECLFAPNP